MDRFGVPPPGFAALQGEGQVRALVLLSLAVASGIATQALFFGAGLGLNFFVWNQLAVVAALAVFRRGPIGAAAWGAAVACLLLGLSVVRFASTWNLAIALPADIVALAAIPLVLNEAITMGELGRVPLRLLLSLTRVPEAAHTVALVPRSAFGDEGGKAARSTWRGLLIGVPTAGFFALLLSADDSFRSAVAWLAGCLGDGTRFIAYSVLTAAAYLVVVAVHDSGEHGEAAVEAPSGVASVGDCGEGRVSPSTWSIVIGLVALVFGVFVASNVRHLFGGAAVVRSPGAETYATYLHSGFALLLCATVLSVGLVLAGHVLLRARDAEPGSCVPGGAVLTWLEVTLLAFTAITLASCWQRLLVYEDAYGASRQRLGVLVVHICVLGLLVLTLGKALLRGWRGYGVSLLVLATTIAVGASHFDADRHIAARNLDRAADGRVLDEDYLASLSRDAGAALAHPVLARSPDLLARLAASWCAPRSGDWREYRGMGRCAP